jgi:speckle-type POZ protein
MLQFMYTFNYINSCGTSPMIYDAQVYQIADKYDIQALKTHAKDRFSAALTASWAMDDFPLAVSLVYSSTPCTDRGLRDLTVETSCRNIDKLLQNDGFHNILRETPNFAADLVPFLCDKPHESIQRYRCRSCGNTFCADFQKGVSYHCAYCGNRRTDWASYDV